MLKRKLVLSVLLGLTLAAPAFPDMSPVAADAQALIATGQCQQAIKALEAAKHDDDASNMSLGMAHLCMAGVDLVDAQKALEAKSHYSIGAFAQKLVPVTEARLKSINEAIASFSRIGAEKSRKDNLETAHLARIAALIASASVDGKSVARADVATAACLEVSCDENPMTCTESPSGQLSDEVVMEIIASAEHVSKLSDPILIPSHMRCQIAQKFLAR